MKIAFFGTSDYCLPVLEALNLNFDLNLVVTRPDKPEGRKQILTPSATKSWALKNAISVITPATLKKDAPDHLELKLKLKQINPDLAIVSDYGLIIPEEIYNLPKYGTFNIHFSKLPDLRGPSPVQYTLLRGDQTAWISIIKIVKEVDAGPILWQGEYPIHPDDTTATLYTRLFQEAAKILPKILNDYSLQAHTFKLKAQDESAATFCRHLTKEDGFIKWDKIQGARAKGLGASEIYNRFRAMTPWPSLWTFDPNNKRLIVRKCHVANGKLILDEVQFEGKKTQKINEL